MPTLDNKHTYAFANFLVRALHSRSYGKVLHD